MLLLSKLPRLMVLRDTTGMITASIPAFGGRLALLTGETRSGDLGIGLQGLRVQLKLGMLGLMVVCLSSRMETTRKPQTLKPKLQKLPACGSVYSGVWGLGIRVCRAEGTVAPPHG